ncbi:hypothetical protein H072_8813 [Dactylellina haptotyla CBS 200.50]|uniref:C2H2-type domain-containing protein n=1 Tax=Dactylellina haptotyla (strain CBS 200.50) TaxID=1284197 RepID=S8BQG9_DACHA|nr:hypothetical protein H072_8813 [Dactylellina haptotyla CBS 200.50]
MSNSRVIREATTACRRSLLQCMEIPRLMIDGWAENRLIDFELWSAGAGVSAVGRLSFDERLVLKPDIRDGIANLINLLKVFIDNCQENAKDYGKIIGRKENEGAAIGADTEEKGISNNNKWSHSQLVSEREAKKDVEVTLDQIIRLTVAIRKAGSGARLLRADKFFDPRNSDLQELRALLELVIHPRGFKPKDRPLSEIQQRLVDVNLQRRHRFKYAKQHSRKLRGPANDSGSELGTPMPINPTLMDNSLDIASKDDPNAQENMISKVDWAQTMPLPNIKMDITASTTAATAIEGSVFIPKESATRASATVISHITSKVVYPRPPKHLATDIRPYTCIFPGCLQPFQTYITRREWEIHLETEHYQRWRCFVCNDRGEIIEFYDKIEMRNHIRKEHQDVIEEKEISVFVDASFSSEPPGNVICPICPGSQSGVDSLEHIAHCVHDFSLRSLPSPSETDLENYFAINTNESESDDRSSPSTDEERNLEGLPGLDYEASLAVESGSAPLTETLLKSVSRLLTWPTDHGALGLSYRQIEEWRSGTLMNQKPSAPTNDNSEYFYENAINSLIPDSNNQIVIDTTLHDFGQHPSIKSILTVAIKDAIRKIISPVVERSVTIATITTNQLVLKDFATEPDENKMRKAARNMARQTAGSLALVTCKEPLRMEISKHIRQHLADNGYSEPSDDSIALVVNDNLDLACAVIEKATREKIEIDLGNNDELQQAYALRRLYHENNKDNGDQSFPGLVTLQPVVPIPESVRLKLNEIPSAQFDVYDNFTHIP